MTSTQVVRRGVPVWLFVLSLVLIFGLGSCAGGVVGLSIGNTISRTDPAPQAVDPLPVDDAPVQPLDQGIAARETVTFSGEGVGSSTRAALAGDYTITWQTFGDCYYNASLDDDIGENVFTADAATTGTTQMYGIAAGDHFVAVNTGPVPSCGWTVTFTPA